MFIRPSILKEILGLSRASNLNLTSFLPCLTGPVDYLFASHYKGPRFKSPGGVLMWNRDFPVRIVSLYWWPRCDWSSWPRLRRASSRTITRPPCWQCDNPTWSHTAFLSRFHARCRSPFRLHNWRSWLLGGSPVESLQSHFILTMTHWSSGLPVYFPPQRNPGSNPQGGTYVKPGFSC